MGILRTSVTVAWFAGIGLGLAVGWGLNEIVRGSLRGGAGPRPREEEGAREPGPCNTALSVPPAPPAAPTQAPGEAFDPYGPGSQACPHFEGWARQRQGHVKAILGEETYRMLEALIRWCWGAPVEEVRAGLPLGRSGFYWRLEQVLARTAPDGAGRSIYVDLHTIALHTARPISKTKHGMWLRVVKALVKVRAVSANPADRGGQVRPEEQPLIEQGAQQALERMPPDQVRGRLWKQLETRLFDQGEWVHKDPAQRVMVVILKPFGNPLMLRACELLCEHLNHLQPVIRCQDGDYALRYAMWDNPPP